MNPQKSRIRVEVQTQYIEHQSAPDEDKYLFSYTITIINLGDEAATLKSRHWVITDGNGQQSEVQGAGVVGETPRIKPNTAYQYSSGTVLETPLGFMEGRYLMETDAGESFYAQIPPFRLAVPGQVH
ncbi:MULTISPECIES: Co2+/Mg2+ efflux protein ApaG [Shewanella]|jgi:ApaG protein|uniref:Protein ApaG n=4 Tax=Bacteria TaxID=2 RepID=A0A380AEE9_9GAMM|nr:MULTISPECIES: Co2+/Mg2+ efflux protein ApaG [Shewanella]AXQ13347.1 Co2+/Mg2+ efflux protein ApaG [Shewanella algae]AYV14882.1 Co2+/Mg2+ efflux protein ApaG [Shewanella algae]EKT4489384.1 Co2+/Mg2+ efflux protein ApaG [Shewanella algae]MBC8797436.1 Co2+/Mg2+ efflux protein ApaG [Shewanella algae]MBO2549059.1 Co2+/Mg2+ efflux protein ApaG [Shewanella algae]